MADEMRLALETLLRKADVEQDVDFLREGARVFSEALMELEVTRHVGAERHERTPERTGQRVPLPRAGVGHAGRDAGTVRAARAGWELLPEPARFAEAGRAGTRGGDAGGVRSGRLDPAGR